MPLFSLLFIALCWKMPLHLPDQKECFIKEGTYELGQQPAQATPNCITSFSVGYSPLPALLPHFPVCCLVQKHMAAPHRKHCNEEAVQVLRELRTIGQQVAQGGSDTRAWAPGGDWG